MQRRPFLEREKGASGSGLLYTFRKMRSEHFGMQVVFRLGTAVLHPWSKREAVEEACRAQPDARLRPMRPECAALLLLLLTAFVSVTAQETPGPATAGPEQRAAGLQHQIDLLTAEPAVARAHWGVLVTTLDGTAIASRNPAQFFQPASNAKLFTTAAAIAVLGPESTVTTRLLSRGPLLAGTLSGDLILEGAGDANFAVDDVPYLPPAAMHARHEAEATPGSPEAAAKDAREAHPLRALEALAEAVAKAGITIITGDVIGDDTLFPAEPYPEAWGLDDTVWGYGAPISALTIHDNQIVLRVTPGATPGSPAVVLPEANLPAWYTFDTTGLTTGASRSGTHVALDRAPGSREVRFWGSIASDAHEDVEVLAIDDPATFAATALTQLLEARGITVHGVARAGHRLPTGTRGFQEIARGSLAVDVPAPLLQTGTLPVGEQVLATNRSSTLADDEILTNKTSQNLHAELLLERLALTVAPEPAAGSGFAANFPIDPGSRALGARVVRSFLLRAGLAPDDFVFFDGSGLSAHDLVTPRATARLLQFAATQPWIAAWKASLPIAGVDGSLASRFARPPLTGHLFAKTGTLGEARALSGYLECRSGRTVIISIFVDTHAPGSTSDREVMDRIVAAVYNAQ